MARRVQWRRKQPDAVTARVEEALQKTLYIVHQTGPTSFVLKEEGKERKFKTCLGDIHQCSCSVYRKSGDLCVHILWVLLKKFRVSRENSVIFQLGLVEREINEILHGNHTNQLQQDSEQQATPTNQPNQSSCVVRRMITQDDVCPICQEEFSVRPIAIIYCKLGCGQNVHVKCMKIWAEHQKGSNGGDPVINCPICRGRFPSLKELCSSDFCIYKPSTETKSYENHHLKVSDTEKKSFKTAERVNRVISQIRAYPLAGDGVTVGRGESCELCGEVYRRGDWLKRLPCRHKFHRDCLDQWLKAGYLLCPVDGAPVLPHKQQSQEKEGGRRTRRKVEKYLEDSLTISGKSIKLPQIPMSAASSRGAMGMVRSIGCATGKPKCEVLPPPSMSHDVSHDTLLPSLQSPTSHPLLTTSTSHPHSMTKRFPHRSIKKGLPSQNSSLTRHDKRRHLSPISESSLLTCLRQCPLSPPHPSHSFPPLPSLTLSSTHYT